MDISPCLKGMVNVVAILILVVLLIICVIIGFLVPGSLVERIIMVSSVMSVVLAAFILWVAYDLFNTADFYLDTEARNEIYTEFIDNKELHPLYRQIHPDAISVEEHAVNTMIAQTIEKEYQSGDRHLRWMQGIVPQISTLSFQQYWANNSYLYSKDFQSFIRNITRKSNNPIAL